VAAQTTDGNFSLTTLNYTVIQQSNRDLLGYVGNTAYDIQNL
jgi:hypothetical protein